MQISNDDLSNKEENKNEKKINVNLQNRKYNLNKLKNVYQEQINQMIIKIDQLKNTKEENEKYKYCKFKKRNRKYTKTK